MLPTNEKVPYKLNKGDICLNKKGVLEYIVNQPLNIPTILTTPQHLYILSDDEIKEGDWCLHLITNNISQCHEKGSYYGDWKKIIASTDSSIVIDKEPYRVIDYSKGTTNGVTIMKERDIIIPSIPQSFIDKYVSEYNVDNIITEVLVEYEKNFYGYFDQGGEDWRLSLKFNPGNTINIKNLKNSWTRNEVIEILNKREKYIAHELTPFMSIDKWIESNL